MPSTRICFKCIRFCKIRVNITVFLKYHAFYTESLDSLASQCYVEQDIRMFGLCLRVQARLRHWKMSEISTATSA